MLIGLIMLSFVFYAGSNASCGSNCMRILGGGSKYCVSFFIFLVEQCSKYSTRKIDSENPNPIKWHFRRFFDRAFYSRWTHTSEWGVLL